MSFEKFALKNVRLSFPSLFQKSVYNGVEGKYEASLLLDKNSQADQIEQIKKAIEECKTSSKIKVGTDKIFLKDGDNYDYDGYQGHMVIKVSTNRRPTVVDRDKTPLVEDDGVIYSGCYVNAIVGCWAQNNNYGKRVNGNLYGIQFVKDGESFGSNNTDVSGEFDDLDDL